MSERVESKRRTELGINDWFNGFFTALRMYAHWRGETLTVGNGLRTLSEVEDIIRSDYQAELDALETKGGS